MSATDLLTVVMILLTLLWLTDLLREALSNPTAHDARNRRDDDVDV